MGQHSTVIKGVGFLLVSSLLVSELEGTLSRFERLDKVQRGRFYADGPPGFCGRSKQPAAKEQMGWSDIIGTNAGWARWVSGPTCYLGRQQARRSSKG